MGDVTEFFQSELKVSKEAAAAIKFAEGMIATMSLVGTVVGAAATLLDFLFGHSDALTKKVDELIEEFRAVTASSESITLMREVALQIEDARTQASAVRSFLPGELNSESQRGIILNNSEQVVRKLGNRSFWLRPFFKEAVYRDAWVGDLPPELQQLGTGATAVFDWRLTLPAYLESIAIRLLVLSALVKDYRINHRAHLSEMADRLNEFRQRIEDGIKLHPAPARFQLAFHRDEQGSIVRSEWDEAGRLLGAVEVHSARHSVIGYPLDRDIDAAPSDETASVDRYPRFLARHGVISLFRWKSVYNEIGLAAVRRIVQHLGHLAGREIAIPESGAWSLREVDGIVARAIGSPNTDSDGRPSAKVLLSRFRDSKSFREALQTMPPPVVPQTDD